jgi:hypothetical protein
VGITIGAWLRAVSDSDTQHGETAEGALRCNEVLDVWRKKLRERTAGSGSPGSSKRHYLDFSPFSRSFYVMDRSLAKQ